MLADRHRACASVASATATPRLDRFYLDRERLEPAI